MQRRNPVFLVIVLAIGIVAAAIGYLVFASDDTITLSDATAVAISETDLAVFVKIENPGNPDAIVGVESDEASSARITMLAEGGSLPVPARSAPSLAVDGAHIVLEKLSGPLEEGRLVPFSLKFRKAGLVTSRARLLPGNGQESHGGHEGVTSPRPPSISISVEPRERSWLVSIETKNFRFDRQAADGAHVEGAGHGHLYVDGLKIMRVYEPVVTLGELPPGEHAIRVTLNGNDHRTYMADGNPVTAVTAVTVEP